MINTYINPDAILDHSITADKLASNIIVQSNWEEIDVSNSAYIENKPAIKAGTGTNAIIACDRYSYAKGDYSFAEGASAIAYGQTSHAEGGYYGGAQLSAFTVSGAANATNYTTSAAHWLEPGFVIGYEDNIAKVTSIANDKLSFTVDNTLSQTALTNVKIKIFFNCATGTSSHVEGYGTKASAHYSHAEGYFAKASGVSSHAEGWYTRTTNYGEHAEGRNNISHSGNSDAEQTLSSIGIGSGSGSLSNLNAVEVMKNGNIYIMGIGSYDGSNYIDASTLQEIVNSGGGGGSTTTDLMTNVTYSELKTLRDSSSLVPGMQYRITDYECTTTQNDTSVAGHVFDIIVTADSSTVLNENAKATWHEGDTYFQNCRLYEWQLKYDLNNDSSLYSWADTSNGKGVVHYMKDEFNNVCYYDFKNVMFKRYMIADSSFDELPYTYTGTYTIGNEHSKLDITSDTNGGVVYDDNDFAWFYTFSAGSLIDVTVLLNEVHLVDGYGLDFACRDNYIEKIFTFTNHNRYLTKKAIMLNNIVIATGEYDGNAIYSWPAIGNYFDFNCESITLHQGCTYRKIGQNCYNIVIFNSIEPETNIVEDYCRNVIIYGDHNFVGHHSEKIYINGENIKLHGNNSYIYLGGGSYPNNVYSSDIGEYCNSISIKGAGQAIIGQGSTDISIGAYSYASIGENCYNITIGEYDNKVTVSERASNFVLSSGTSNTNLSNVTVLPGDYGNATIAFEAGKSYEQYAGINSSNAIKIWTPADLID